MDLIRLGARAEHCNISASVCTSFPCMAQRSHWGLEMLDYITGFIVDQKLKFDTEQKV